MPENLVDIDEAHNLTGYSKGYLRILAGKGKIEADKMGNSWVINKESLLAFAQKQKRADGRYGPKPRE